MMSVVEFWMYSNLPENEDRPLDLLRGEVIEWPRGTLLHGLTCPRVGCVLHEYAKHIGIGFATLGGVGVVLPSPPESLLGVDVGFYTGPISDRYEDTGWDKSLPVIAAEVRAETHPEAWERAKIEEYLRHEIPFVWSIDPTDQTVTVFQPDRPAVAYGESDVLSLEIIKGRMPLRFHVGDVFVEPARRKSDSWIIT